MGLEQVFKRFGQDNMVEEKRLKTQITESEKKLNLLEKRFAFGEIESELFKKFSNELKTTLLELRQNLEALSQPSSNQQNYLNKGLKMMLSLSESWDEANVSQRTRMQKLLYPRGIHFDRKIESFRTSGANAFFALSKLLSQNLGQKKEGKPDVNHPISPLVELQGPSPLQTHVNSCEQISHYTCSKAVFHTS